MDVLMVGLGGAMGASLRYALGMAIAMAVPRAAIPLSTLAVNVLGSLALGIVLGVLFNRVPSNPELLENSTAVVLGVGFCGAFTTFSTFSVEMTHLLRRIGGARAFLYLAMTIAGSVGAFLAGMLTTT